MFSAAEMQPRIEDQAFPSESCRRHPWHSRDVPPAKSSPFQVWELLRLNRVTRGVRVCLLIRHQQGGSDVEDQATYPAI
jgi:hypothetical protein